MLSTGFLSGLLWLFTIAQGNFSSQALRLYRPMGWPRGLITFPKHLSSGLRSLPVAADRDFKLCLRCRITVANGVPASFHPIARSVHDGFAAAGDSIRFAFHTRIPNKYSP